MSDWKIEPKASFFGVTIKRYPDGETRIAIGWGFIAGGIIAGLLALIAWKGL